MTTDGAPLPLVRGRATAGTLRITRLLDSDAVLIDRAKAPDRAASAPRYALREASVYRYVIEIDGPIADIAPRELFEPDDVTLRTGRIHTRQYVGEVRVEVSMAGDGPAAARVEVLPYKLATEQAFRGMLADLAELAVEVLHRAFAPNADRFQSEARTPRMLYQQFALLHQLLLGEELQWALARILSEPHHEWMTEVQHRPLGAPVKGSSRVARSLTRSGRHGVDPAGLFGPTPRTIPVDHIESTLDNVPNRYLRFVLERWRAIAAETQIALRAIKQGSRARRRGELAVERVIDRLDEVLADPLFREVGGLRVFPQGNQTLLKRDGYRQVARAAAIIESALGLDLGVSEPLLVSQRSVSDLYELWSFVRLVRAVGAACQEDRTPDLFEVTDHGIALRLKRGRASLLRFTPEVGGCKLDVQLFFHPVFDGDSTWTHDMHPDCSLLIRPDSSETETRIERWVHFDAKYRVDGTNVLGEDDAKRDRGARRNKPTDLLKMHAYRDAIRGSAAAYVLFPGDRATHLRYGDETLPAIGAFPLHPETADEDSRVLQRIIEAIFRNVADQASRDQRSSFWRTRTYEADASPDVIRSVSFLERPPADTQVLVGYVRSASQRRWIESHHLYNLRGDDRTGAVGEHGEELAARLMLLYGRHGWNGPPRLFRRVGLWSARDRDGMERLRYPGANGDAYFVCALEPIDRLAWLEHVDPEALAPADHAHGAPFVTTWLDVLLAAADAGP